MTCLASDELTQPSVLLVGLGSPTLLSKLGAHGLRVSCTDRRDLTPGRLDALRPDLIAYFQREGDEITSMVQRQRLDGIGAGICVISSTASSADRIAILDAGADDHVVMPCTVPELAARFRAVLRRVRWTPIEDLVFPAMTISLIGRTVYSHGHWVEVSRQEFDVLVVLANKAGRVVSREDLLRTIWAVPASMAARSNVLNVCISSLRGKLEATGAARMIHTVRGIGYVFRA
ncbi:response regulator transcription factor [Rhodococcus sp. NPDC057529]|uniref:response regulator transcription factor n=1 Tax=Rhodococcus sp. NPDC057529 TaxID=3346158 RepID=UPI003671BC75